MTYCDNLDARAFLRHLRARLRTQQAQTKQEHARLDAAIRQHPDAMVPMLGFALRQAETMSAKLEKANRRFRACVRKGLTTPTQREKYDEIVGNLNRLRTERRNILNAKREPFTAKRLRRIWKLQRDAFPYMRRELAYASKAVDVWSSSSPACARSLTHLCEMFRALDELDEQTVLRPRVSRSRRRVLRSNPKRAVRQHQRVRVRERAPVRAVRVVERPVHTQHQRQP